MHQNTASPEHLSSSVLESVSFPSLGLLPAPVLKAREDWEPNFCKFPSDVLLPGPREEENGLEGEGGGMAAGLLYLPAALIALST